MAFCWVPNLVQKREAYSWFTSCFGLSVFVFNIHVQLVGKRRENTVYYVLQYVIGALQGNFRVQLHRGTHPFASSHLYFVTLSRSQLCSNVQFYILEGLYGVFTGLSSVKCEKVILQISHFCSGPHSQILVTSPLQIQKQNF